MHINVCLITCPDRDVGLNIANQIVSEKLAACVNIVPSVCSVYRWNDEVRISDEVMLVVKTVEKQTERLKTRLHELHPYSVPEFVVLTPTNCSEKYAAWIDSCL